MMLSCDPERPCSRYYMWVWVWVYVDILLLTSIKMYSVIRELEVGLKRGFLAMRYIFVRSCTDLYPSLPLAPLRSPVISLWWGRDNL